MVFDTITLAIRVIIMTKLNKPTFEDKDHGKGAGIPVLKTIWELLIYLFCSPKQGLESIPGFLHGY